MKRWMGIIGVGLALSAALALGWPARPALAANCADDQRVMGNSYVLAAGETLDRNLIVLGGSATISEGAVLHCALVVVGGNADVAGTVEGDVTAFGGNVTVRSTGVLTGDLTRVGGVIDCEAGATGCSSTEASGLNVGSGPWHVSENAYLNSVLAWYQHIFQTFVTALVLGLLALLVVVFWPEQAGRVSAAVTSAPAAAGGLGLLTLVAVPVLLVVATVTICLIPVAFVGAVIFAAAIVLGWIALGYIVGTRLTAYLRLREISPAVAAGFGTAGLWLLSSALGGIPCIGWVAGVVLSAVGLGAVTLTRFGTQPYLPRMYPPMHPPSAPTPPDVEEPPALPPVAPPDDAPDLSAL
jgi:hypothetical protein